MLYCLLLFKFDSKHITKILNSEKKIRKLENEVRKKQQRIVKDITINWGAKERKLKQNTNFTELSVIEKNWRKITKLKKARNYKKLRGIVKHLTLLN